MQAGIMSRYEDMAEMIRLGAYQAGANAEVDEAIHYYPALEAFLRQSKDEPSGLDATYQALSSILLSEPESNGEEVEGAGDPREVEAA